MDNNEMREVSRNSQLDLETLKALAEDVGNEKLVVDATWYVISQTWWNKLLKAINDGYMEDIGEIDNSDISEQGKKGWYMKKGLSEGIDFQTVPEAVFSKLRDAFGTANQFCDYIPRKVVVKKSGAPYVEVYPRIINVSLLRNKNISSDLTIRPTDTMTDLRDRVLVELNITMASHQPKFYVMNDETPELVDTRQPVDSYFDTAQKVVVDTLENGDYVFNHKPNKSFSRGFGEKGGDDDEEEEDDDGDERGAQARRRPTRKTRLGGVVARLGSPFFAMWWRLRLLWWQFSLAWPDRVRDFVGFLFGWWLLLPPPRSVAANGAFGTALGNPNVGDVGRVLPGYTGLTNLGNTCFMASALQCISNMPPIRDYFVTDAYIRDINVDNPLGTHGKLAKAIGDLLKVMWSGNYNNTMPRNVKSVIGQFAPRFSGYSQQDSHELMAYVLDGLHEDLNRIKKKPYFEDNDELAKLPEQEYAAKSWELYRMRNDSIIVDTLHGQLKSTLVCPICSKISIKFDPFCYLSLPLPSKETHVKQTITGVFFTRKWAKFVFTMLRQTTVKDVESQIRSKLGIEKSFYMVFFCMNSTSSNFFTDDATILRPTDLVYQNGKEVYAVEVEYDPTAPRSKILVVHNQGKVTGRQCTLPLIYTLHNEEQFTRQLLTNKVLEYTMSRFVSDKKSDLDETNGNSNGSANANGNGIGPSENQEMYTLQMAGGKEIPMTNDPLPWPRPPDGNPYNAVKHVVFIWKDYKMFNFYRGLDLVEREFSIIPARRKIHLMETLDWFTQNEQLGEDDLWYCPNCKKHERASKKLDLWRLPEIMILHLKRFTYTRWTREKLNWDVVVPVRELDLTSKLANDKHEKAVYDLVAMSLHFGSLSGGHYTAAAINQVTGEWVNFNDGHAVQMKSPPRDPYETAEPYMLVYRRRPNNEADGASVGAGPGARVRQTAVHDENMEMELDEDYS